MAVDNLAAANPNRRGQSISGNTRAPRGARRRLALGEANSSNRSNDGSPARSPRTSGGGGRPHVADCPDEDGLDDQFDLETFLNTPMASDHPMLKHFGVYLK